MFGRLQLYIIGGVLLFGVLTGIYYSWRKSIEHQALLEYNQNQIEQNIKDQQAIKQKLVDIEKTQSEITAANAADKKEFKGKMDQINSSIDSKTTVDRPASDVLKKTLTKLKDASK